MITWNPFTPGYFDNPYEHLNKCRKLNPIQKGVHQEWMLFRYKDVKHVLKSDRFNVSNLSGYFALKEQIIIGNSGCPFLAMGTKKWLMYLNGEEHTKASELADKALRGISFINLIDDAVASSIEEFRGMKSFNLGDLASRIPYFVSAKMMGFGKTLPYEKLLKFSHSLAISQDLYISKAQYRDINNEFEWMYSFFRDVLDGRKKLDDKSIVYLISDINAKEKVFNHQDELISLFCVLFMASFETTKDSLGVMLHHLMTRPQLIEYIIDSDEKKINVLVEELLRITSPLQYTIRVCKEDVEMGNFRFSPGTKLYLCLASANRDEEVFHNPDEIIPGRTENPHLSFGVGIHSCLGARISRIEIRRWLKPLASFLKYYTLDEEEKPEWQRTIFMRGLKSVQIKSKA